MVSVHLRGYRHSRRAGERGIAWVTVTDHLYIYIVPCVKSNQSSGLVQEDPGAPVRHPQSSRSAAITCQTRLKGSRPGQTPRRPSDKPPEEHEILRIAHLGHSADTKRLHLTVVVGSGDVCLSLSYPSSLLFLHITLPNSSCVLLFSTARCQHVCCM